LDNESRDRAVEPHVVCEIPVGVVDVKRPVAGEHGRLFGALVLSSGFDVPGELRATADAEAADVRAAQKIPAVSQGNVRTGADDEVGPVLRSAIADSVAAQARQG